jgi:hypothetical protein
MPPAIPPVSGGDTQTAGAPSFNDSLDSAAQEQQVAENLMTANLLAGVVLVSTVLMPMIMKDKDDGGIGGFNIEQ